jgi:hypothetical protein
MIEEGKGLYNIFKITNENPGVKEKKRYYFVTGVYDDPDKVLTRIRGIAKSKAVRGGAKNIASDMARDGSDYEDHFDVKLIAKGMSKEDALKMRNRLKEKTPPKKQYNEPR